MFATAFDIMHTVLIKRFILKMVLGKEGRADRPNFGLPVIFLSYSELNTLGLGRRANYAKYCHGVNTSCPQAKVAGVSLF